MRDIAERTTVHKSRYALGGLHQIWQYCIVQQSGHRACRPKTLCRDRIAGTVESNQDAPQARFEIGEVFSQAEDGHDFGSRSNVEPGFPRHAVEPSSQSDHRLPQRTIVHIQHTAPENLAMLQIQSAAEMNGVVEQSGKQVMRHADGVHVTGKVHIDAR